MSWGDKKNFCDLTDPHWVCLGTHRHPWVLPNRYLQRANFFVFWAISRISKVNNIFTCIVIAKNILCDLTDPQGACLGTPTHPWELPIGSSRELTFLFFERFQKFQRQIM